MRLCETRLLTRNSTSAEFVQHPFDAARTLRAQYTAQIAHDRMRALVRGDLCGSVVHVLDWGYVCSLCV